MKPNFNQTAITYGVITGLIFLVITLRHGQWEVQNLLLTLPVSPFSFPM